MLKTATLNADDMQVLLNALTGPDHHIRELQYTMNIPGGNALSRIIEDWNNQLTAAQNAAKAPAQVQQDAGPWSISDSGKSLQSGDFKYDVRIDVDGDFGDARPAYMAWLRDVLNGSVKEPGGEDDALDAARWRAFVNCRRIRLIGWAGYSAPDPNGDDPGNYRHFGAEFWTKHDGSTANPDEARMVLEGFADAAIAEGGA